MKKLISILILAAMVLTLTVSCANEGNTPNTVTTAADTEKDTSPADPYGGKLPFIVGGKSSCTILFGEDTYSEAKGDTLRTALHDYFGATVNVRNAAAVSYDKNAYEILVGLTNRPETATGKEKVTRYDDYYVGAVGHKLVIYANTEEALTKAVSYFLTTFVYVCKKSATGDLLLTPGKEFTFSPSYMIDSLTIDGEPISSYRIVYPKEEYHMELYAAITLQEWIWKKAGYLIPLVADTDSPKQDYEILVGPTNRDPSAVAQTGKFYVKGGEKKLQISGTDMNSYYDVSQYLTGTLLFKNKEISLDKNFSYVGDCTTKSTATKVGEYRAIFHNMWGHDPNGVLIANFENYELSLVTEYNPDFFCINEYWDNCLRRYSTIVEKLTEMGYTEAKPTNDNRAMSRFPMYKTDKFDLLDCIFISTGSVTDYVNYVYDESANPTTRGVTAAVLQDKATKNKIIVVAAHLESNVFVTGQTADNGDPVRAKQISIIVPKLNELAGKYGVDYIIMGGDYNSTDSRVACTDLVKAGYFNTRTVATIKNDVCSCNGYPTYDYTLKQWISGNKITYGGSSGSIDQCFAKGNFNVGQYRVMEDWFITILSDHKPLMVDFTLKTAPQ